MKVIGIDKLRKIDGGAHCRYCCQDMGYFTYLVHGIGNSYHIQQKKLHIKCNHK